MMFEVEEHPLTADTAAFLGNELHGYPDHEIAEKEAQAFANYSEPGGSGNVSPPLSGRDDIMPPSGSGSGSGHGPIESRYNYTIASNSQKINQWSEEGTGLKRMNSKVSPTNPSSTNLPPLSSTTTSAAANGTRTAPDTITRAKSTDSFELHDHDQHNNTTFASSQAVVSALQDSNLTSNNNTTSNTTTTPPPTTSITPLMNKETFEAKSERLRLLSPYGSLPTWRLMGLIAKSNDDLRQEVYILTMHNN